VTGYVLVAPQDSDIAPTCTISRKNNNYSFIISILIFSYSGAKIIRFSEIIAIL